jgi:hypothetical protein
MKQTIQILLILIILTFFCFEKVFSCTDIDTSKRYNCIIEYIKKDKIIREIIYPVYHEICALNYLIPQRLQK